MTQKFSIHTKAATVAVLKSGIPVTKLSARTGISRTTLYKWLKAGDLPTKTKAKKPYLSKKKEAEVRSFAIHHAELPLEAIAKRFNLSKSYVWKILEKKGLTTREKRKKFQESYYRHERGRLRASVYTTIISKSVKKQTVTSICKELTISRTTYYNAKKRFKKKKPVENTRPAGALHYRFIEFGVEEVLEIVKANPEFSLRSIAEELRDRHGVGSCFYVYSVLKQHNLTTRSQRTTYLMRLQL